MRFVQACLEDWGPGWARGGQRDGGSPSLRVVCRGSRSGRPGRGVAWGEAWHGQSPRMATPRRDGERAGQTFLVGGAGTTDMAGGHS